MTQDGLSAKHDFSAMTESKLEGKLEHLDTHIESLLMDVQVWLPCMLCNHVHKSPCNQ